MTAAVQDPKISSPFPTPHRVDETDLLLACARSRLAPEHGSRISELLSQSLDWEHILGCAHRNGLLPLMAKHLLHDFAPLIPAAIVEQLNRESQQNAQRNLYLAAELLNILKLFENEGILVIPYKGPALALGLYGDLSARSSLDLDLITKQVDGRKARALLEANGYQLETPLTAAEEEVHLRTGCDHLLRNRKTGLGLELHWAIAPRYLSIRFREEWLWEDTMTLSLQGTSALVPNPEVLLLVLCIHGTKHLWFRISWLSDLARLIELHPEMDWTKVFAYAEQSGTLNALHLALVLCSELLGATVPGESLTKVRSDRRFAALVSDVRRSVLQNAGFEPAPVRTYWFLWRVRERRADRLRYMFRLALTPGTEEWSVVKLPRRLFPLYRLIRIVRMLGKYSAMLAAWLLAKCRGSRQQVPSARTL